MNIIEMPVRLTLTREALGTKTFNDDLYLEYLAEKLQDGSTPAAVESDEQTAQDAMKEALDLDEELQKNSSGFHRNENGEPIIWDYQIKGFFKGSAKFLRRHQTTKERLISYKQEVDGAIFIAERSIPFNLHGKEMGWCERTLRVETMQGPRTCIARSETVPEGSTLEFTVKLLGKSLVPHVKEWFEYGQLHGLGQWRNGGKGTFTTEYL